MQQCIPAAIGLAVSVAVCAATRYSCPRSMTAAVQKQRKRYKCLILLRRS